MWRLNLKSAPPDSRYKDVSEPSILNVFLSYKPRDGSSVRGDGSVRGDAVVAAEWHGIRGTTKGHV